MAVNLGHEPVISFDQWYVGYDPTGGRDGALEFRGHTPCADHIYRQYLSYKNEMDARVGHYDVLERLADAEVISPKPDLPNISSGETAGLVRRMARNLVQNAPNVEVISCYDDDTPYGIFSRFILTSKIIGSDLYAQDMQQNLFASTKTALTLGFATVIPVLLRDPANGWYMKYDNIHYRDVFPEPGCKDIRDATAVFIRRYLTKGEIVGIIRDQTPGWDHAALRLLLTHSAPTREHQSIPHQTKKHRAQTPEGYEIITLYTNSGDPFLTFDARYKLLLRIERNKHPLDQHPVHFLVLEKDEYQPLGKSQVELLVGRQDFQDLMLNGAMKLWYRNINPSIIGYGTVDAIPNLSPGKYTQISNPNAKVEAFEVNTQTLMQYGQISAQNLGSMVQMVGAADQQMAQASGAQGGMSATPQGVEAQQALVDITTNNFQKALEAFCGHYYSYALTVFFQELKAVEKVHLTADARIKLIEAGFPIDKINEDDTVNMPFAELAKDYWVRCVPGSLTEMEDEKQVRILNQLFVPLSQAMPAIAASQDQQAMRNAVAAMNYIIAKQIELSGSASAKDIGMLWKTGDTEEVNERDARIAELEGKYSGIAAEHDALGQMTMESMAQMREQLSGLTENFGTLLDKLGVTNEPSADSSATAAPAA